MPPRAPRIDRRAPAWERDAGRPERALDGLLNARRVRRMSDYVKLTLAATTLACRDAGISDTAASRAMRAVLGSTHGSSNHSKQYYDRSSPRMAAATRPLRRGRPNAGAAQLSLMLSLKGACQTVIGTRTAGLDALALARRIRGGVWDRAMRQRRRRIL